MRPGSLNKDNELQPLVGTRYNNYTTSFSGEQPIFVHSTSTLSTKSYPTELHLSAESVSFAFTPSASTKIPSTMDDLAHMDSQTELELTQLSILDPYFDATPSRVRLAFDEVDPDKSGYLTHDQFRQALESVGIRCRDQEVFQTLLDSLAESHGKITYEDFEVIVQKLKLGNLFEEDTMALFRDDVYAPARIEICDFSSTRLALYKPDLRAFFTSEAAPWVTCRWINMQGHDHLNLKRLAIKYRLHPLAMEDTIELNERPKFDVYETHRFVVFPVLRHTLRKVPSIHHKVHATKDMTYEEFGLKVEHVSIFVVGDNTLITVKSTTETSIWNVVHRRLASTYSKVRHNDANFLLYTVLDVIVDQMTGVMDDVRSYLMQLEQDLAQLRHNFDIVTLHDVHNELGQLPRIFKPTRDVLKSLLESKDLPDTTRTYLRDVRDHLNHILDEIEWQFQMCRSMIEDYRDAKATQVNYVVYTLTIVTTVFLPAQFLTGVYGMNFDYMPELHSKYGYVTFWAILVFCTVGLHFYFRHKQWV